MLTYALTAVLYIIATEVIGLACAYVLLDRTLRDHGWPDDLGECPVCWHTGSHAEGCGWLDRRDAA